MMTTYATSEQGPYAPANRALFMEASRAAPASRTAPTPAPAPVAPPRASLFGIVTGALRRRPTGTDETEASEAPPRHDTDRGEPEPDMIQASVRPSSGDEMGLDIPAFLRRQSS
jgi:cell division protein FtsZ